LISTPTPTDAGAGQRHWLGDGLPVQVDHRAAGDGRVAANGAQRRRIAELERGR